MSKIFLMTRPWTEFDASNREHRKYYAEFLQFGNWGRCPYRFVDPSDCGNLAGSMQRSVAEYYAKKEFGKIKTRLKVPAAV
jgi:hypothetical protein